MIDLLGLLRGLFAHLLGDLVPVVEPNLDDRRRGQVRPLKRRRVAAAPDASESRGEKAPPRRPLELLRHLPPEPAAVPEAQDALASLASAVDPKAFANLRLLVTELVANSVRHGSTESSAPIELSVVAAPHRVRTEVADTGPGFTARRRREGHDQGSGWGLYLLERLSDCWGVERNGRTVVWFELEAEFEPEWWLSPSTDHATRAVRAKRASARGTKPHSGGVRRLASVPSLIARGREPEPDVD